MQINDSRTDECKSLELSVPDLDFHLQHNTPGIGHTVKGYAVFDGPTLTGIITFVSRLQLCGSLIL